MITFFLFILAENIQSAYDEIVTKYGISEKVTAVVTDNGANVVKAFSVPSLVQVEDGEDEDEGDEFSMVQDEDSDTDTESEHLRCACHTVQLVVKDGLKKCPTGALKKANSIIKHTRHSLRGAETLEDNNASRLQPCNATRWSSQLTAIESVLNLDLDLLNQLDPNHKLTA